MKPSRNVRIRAGKAAKTAIRGVGSVLRAFDYSAEVMSPSQFVKMFANKHELSGIKSVKIVPPKIGSNSFGEILVER